jgi:hypothetical protein
MTCALIISAALLYKVKYDTTKEANHIVQVKNEIIKEKETIQLLKAEWAYVNRPENIQALAQKYLDLRPIGLTQIGLRGGLPEKQGVADDPIGRMLEALERANRELPTASRVIKPQPKPKVAPPILAKPVLKPQVKPQSLTDLIEGMNKGAKR